MSAYSIPSVITQHPRGDRVMDVYSHLLSERIIYLGTAIDSGVANVLVAQLLHLESQGGEQEINLYINSEGGDLSAMLAIYDTMQFITSPVATTCIGEAVGASAALLAAGEAGRRSALRHSRIVLHQPTWQGRGTVPDLILQADELVRIRADLEQVLSDHSGQSAATLRQDTDRARIFTAEHARDYGLIDEVRTRTSYAAKRTALTPG